MYNQGCKKTHMQSSRKGRKVIRSGAVPLRGVLSVGGAENRSPLGMVEDHCDKHRAVGSLDSACEALMLVSTQGRMETGLL